MGIFNRLFGRKQSNNTAKKSNNISFNSTDELMEEERFWKIIDKANKNSKGNYEKELEIIEEELRKLSPADIIIFTNRFRYFRGKANTWELWGAIYLIHGGCGDDSFNDFREWIIAQGKDFYYRTVNAPEILIDIDSERFEDSDWEGFGYIMSEVFEEKTGQEMPATFQEQFETTGKEWSEDSDDLKHLLPKLYAKYSD